MLPAMQSSELQRGIDLLVEGAALGRSWREPLMITAKAVGAHGAAVTRFLPNGQLLGVPSPSLDDRLSEFSKIRATPLSKNFLVLKGSATGFVTNTDRRTVETLTQNSFYHDVTKKLGLWWRAAAHLQGDTDTSLRLSFWRDDEQGPFEPDQIAALNAVFPAFKAAAIFTNMAHELQATIAASPFETRGEPIYFLGSTGTVLRQNLSAEAAAGYAIVHRRGKLVAADGDQQKYIDGAIASANGILPKPAVTTITNGVQNSLLVTMPIIGEARDVWGVTTAIAVVIDLDRRAPNRGLHKLLKLNFKLTEKEAEVAGLIAAGNSPGKVGALLNISVGTTRVHLKSVLQKMGINRQTELVMLLSRLNGIK